MIHLSRQQAKDGDDRGRTRGGSSFVGVGFLADARESRDWRIVGLSCLEAMIAKHLG